MTDTPDAESTEPEAPRIEVPALKLLSYNIQVGLHTRDYGHMLTGMWRHALPSRDQRKNLDRIAEMMSEYDFVAVQEADAGSLRSSQLNQIEYLAARAGFNHCGYTVTRNLRPVARHCLGWLSKTPPTSSETHSLPSQIPGRAAMKLRFDDRFDDLTLLVAHLSLGPKDRRLQLDYLSRMAHDEGRVMVLGDLNSGTDFLRQHPSLDARALKPVDNAPLTYPSWKPRQSLDHVLITPDVRLTEVRALPLAISDHRPLSVLVERLRRE
jgi:endonuclease/exonuclease/phosphatase family metal-dependent hydrolase